MRTADLEMQEPDTALITIGELARQVGTSAATLRMWESRHGFPQARRLASGHRRYDPATVDSVRAVLRRQAAGVRLEAAIAEVTVTAPATPSVYAELRRTAPQLEVRQLRKATLIALSHAIEDEATLRTAEVLHFGAFQEQRHLDASAARWQDLAHTARATFAFAAGSEGGSPPGVTRVALADGAPMRREWAVVSLGTGFAVALSAWELPGQAGVADRDRRFEAVWTVDPRTVRSAAHTCAAVAAEAGHPEPLRLLTELPPPNVTGNELDVASRLFARMVAYVEDRLG